MSNSDTLTASHYPRFRPFPNETCDRSVRVYSHGFLFVLAVNRIACAGRACAGRACAGRAPVSSRAPRRVAMPTTWERTHHANPDARQHPHHTPTLRSLEPYYYYLPKRRNLLLPCLLASFVFIHELILEVTIIICCLSIIIIMIFYTRHISRFTFVFQSRHILSQA